MGGAELFNMRHCRVSRGGLTRAIAGDNRPVRRPGRATVRGAYARAGRCLALLGGLLLLGGLARPAAAQFTTDAFPRLVLTAPWDVPGCSAPATTHPLPQHPDHGSVTYTLSPATLRGGRMYGRGISGVG